MHPSQDPPLGPPWANLDDRSTTTCETHHGSFVVQHRGVTPGSGFGGDGPNVEGPRAAILRSRYQKSVHLNEGSLEARSRQLAARTVSHSHLRPPEHQALTHGLIVLVFTSRFNHHCAMGHRMYAERCDARARVGVAIEGRTPKDLLDPEVVSKSS